MPTEKRLPSPEDRAVIAAMIEALDVPRDRLGRLVTDRSTDQNLTAHGLRMGIPNGGVDRVDKAVMVLQLLIGRKASSIAERT